MSERENQEHSADDPSVGAPEEADSGSSEEQSASLHAALEEMKDKYVRALAEMENMRRRHERDRSDIARFSLEGPLRELLPVLDGFDKALQPMAGAAPELEAYRTGFRMIYEQLSAALQRTGLQGFKSAGQPFDPNIHQAIQRIESDRVETETVQDEFVAGYLLNGKLLRPAMVSVLVPTAVSSKSPAGSGSDGVND